MRRSSHDDVVGVAQFEADFQQFPRCMECRRGLAMRYILSVRLSVSLSVERVHCEKSVQIFIPYERYYV